MSTTFKGTACGVLAAVAYGTNPLGAERQREKFLNENFEK